MKLRFRKNTTNTPANPAAVSQTLWALQGAGDFAVAEAKARHFVDLTEVVVESFSHERGEISVTGKAKAYGRTARFAVVSVLECDEADTYWDAPVAYLSFGL